MRARLAALTLLAILAAGCGSAGGSSTSDAAGLVPGGALAYLTVNTDLGSGQLESAQSVLDKFPIKPQLVAELKKTLRNAGVNPAVLKRSVGPQVDLAILNVNGETNAVAFTQPTDEKQFEQQLTSSGATTVHEKIGGWTVFAEKQPFLDAVKNRKGKLSDVASYADSLSTVPTDAIARAYIAPAAIGQAVSLSGVGPSLPLNTKDARWATAALTSSSGAVKLEIHAKGVAQSASQAASDLAAQIPSGSIVALDLQGIGKAVNQQALNQAKSLVPVFDVSGILQALGDDTIAYVRAGLPIPEVTLASKPRDVQKALRTVGTIVQAIAPGQGATSTVTVDGVVLKKVDLGSFAVFYGAFDGELVVSDSQNAVAELRAKGDKLADDSVFKEARDGAGMADTGEGFLFVNLKDAVPAAEGLAQFANQTIPQRVDENLKPLRSLLAFGSKKGGVQSFVAFLQTS